MIITPLALNGCYLIEQQEYKDERGSFARQFCKNEFRNAGIDFDIKQCNVSKNYKVGVLRGMHYQKEPYPEIKMVSVFKGAIYDVLVDLRPQSPTYLKWISQELSEDNNRAVYIAAGIAHGFQTLKDNTVVYYQLGEFFMPEYYSGVRWNDPKLNIKWPECKNRIINARDAAYELIR